ncbi:NYN domain-containing protein [Roseateles sp. BYS87W]|uniref:NYN domain-containing protein n=1 Tax=Pelomonas baiyunensis TaxID=3299026 RepID=A0ABW7GTV7_9BURK
MNASGKKVAFLVDFDNVATDVIEQALTMVFKDYGAAHIRRAYCNAEQAHHQQAFMKRLGLRAIVNLAIGKNSTDIALAADAMDIAITERPDVIVLVSSDSDFAPLVLRLREKGAWLRGFGQYGKTGDGVIQIYDQFNELAHGVGRPARDAAPAKPTGSGRRRGGRGGRGGTEGRGNNAPVARAPRAEALPAPAATPAAVPQDVLDHAPEVVVERPELLPAAPQMPDVPEVVADAAAPVPASAKSRRKPVGKAAKAAAAEASAPAEAQGAVAAAEPVTPQPNAKPSAKAAAKRAKGDKRDPAAAPAPAAKAPATAAPSGKAPLAPAPTADDPQVAAAKEINAVLALLPKLADGQWHDLGAAAKALKDAGLLAKSAPATKLFRKHAHAFELQPEKQPNRVRFAT